jgi:hypothetical protein
MPIQSQAIVAYSLSFALLILMKIVVFILGYLTVRLGHQLIASGVKGEFKFAAELAGVKADLASVSPGLLFVLLGVLLIGYAVSVDKRVDLTMRGLTQPAQMDQPPREIPEQLPPR